MMQMIKRHYRRRALTKPNLAYFLWRYVANGGRTARALRRRGAFPDAITISQEISRHGIVVGQSDDFLTEEGRQALVEASAEILKLSQADDVQRRAVCTESNSDQLKDFIVYLVPHDQELPADSPLVRLAADRKLLEIVSSYLGFLPRLHAISAWLNYPTDQPAKVSQLWHRDPEDLKIVKVFIYLVDVDENCGPFTYIPDTHPFGSDTARALQYEKRKRVLDDEIGSDFPPQTWRTCTGPKNTMILADTVGYHRGGKPSKGQRILMTFTYASATPLTDRSFHIRGEPSWVSDEIQEYAL